MSGLTNVSCECEMFMKHMTPKRGDRFHAFACRVTFLNSHKRAMVTRASIYIPRDARSSVCASWRPPYLLLALLLHDVQLVLALGLVGHELLPMSCILLRLG